MYASFFGLRSAPFSIAPDPRYLFMSERHREALAHLLYGIRAGGGFVLLSGEIGAGKTTVCRCFLEHLPAQCRVAYIFNPKLSAGELLQTVCDEWHIDVVTQETGRPTVKDYTDALNTFLLNSHAQGASCVLVIDEAQNLSADVLEQLRLLTNLETHERKLLQIILIGQPELRDLLARPELEQLAQRVVARCHLGALAEAETALYVRHRLSVAGLTTAMPFDADVLRRIHHISRGVPRRINLLCDRALLGAFTQGQRQVDRRILQQAAAEVFDAHTGVTRRWEKQTIAAWVAAGAALAVGLAGGLWAASDSRGWARLTTRDGSGMAAVPTVVGAPAQAASVGAPARPSVRASSEAVLAAAPLPASAASATRLAGTASVATVATGAVAGLPSAVASAPSVPAVAAAPPLASAPAAAGAGRDPVDATGAPVWSEALWWRDEDAAWRAAAMRWGEALPPGANACQTLARITLPCFRSRGSLALIRQLDRPTLLTLVGARGESGQVLLLGFSGSQALLNTAGGALRVPVDVLVTQWRGDFTTLWRSPPGYQGVLREGQRGTGVAHLQRLLDLAEGRNVTGSSSPEAASPSAVFDAALRERVFAFQARQGLVPDGLAGPTTFMLLGRVTGAAEPRLQTRS